MTTAAAAAATASSLGHYSPGPSPAEYITTPEDHGWNDAAASYADHLANSAAFGDALADASANAASSVTGRGVVELEQGKVYILVESDNGSANIPRGAAGFSGRPNVHLRTAGQPTAQGSKAILRHLDWAVTRAGFGSDVHNRSLIHLAKAVNVWVTHLRVDGNKYSIGADQTAAEAFLANDISYAAADNGGLHCIADRGSTGTILEHVEAYNGVVDSLSIDRFESDGTRTTGFLAINCDFHHSRRQGCSLITGGVVSGGEDQIRFIDTKFRNTGDDSSGGYLLRGEAPGANFDVEPNNTGDTVYGLTHLRSEFTASAGSTFELGSVRSSTSGRGVTYNTKAVCQNHKYIDCSYTGNRGAGWHAYLDNAIDFTGLTFEGGTFSGNNVAADAAQLWFDPFHGTGAHWLNALIVNVNVPEIRFDPTETTGHSVTIWLGEFNPTITRPNNEQTVTVNSGFPGGSPAATLISRYTLNGGAATDDIGGVNGTVVGTWDANLGSMVSGVGGTSMYKAGGAPHITLPANQTLHDLNQLSLVLYYQPSGATAKHTIFACGNGTAPGHFSIERIHTNGRLRAWHVGQDGSLRHFEGSGGIAATNLVIGTAYRISLTLGPSGAKIYLNGDLVASIPQNTNGWNNSAAKYVGIWVDAAAAPAEGVFDQIRIWNGELTATQVAGLGAPVSVELPSTPSTTVLPPAAPASYTVPVGGTVITTAAQLTTQLASSPAKDIILANGTYDKASPWSTTVAHRLWAQNLGMATLTAGLDFTGSANGGAVVGIKFDVATGAKKVSGRRDGACLRFNVNTTNGSVKDCWFEGHLTVGNAVDVLGLHGFDLRRVVITNFTNNGLNIHDYPTRTVANPPVYVSDVNIDTIVSSTHQKGQAEFGINAGTAGTYERIKTRNCYWSGIVPCNACFPAVFRDIDIATTNNTGFYFEHWSGNVLLERFVIHHTLSNGVGINFEAAQNRWACDPCNIWTSRGLSGPVTIQDGVITSNKVAINVSYCNGRTNETKITVRRVKFIGQCACAIANAAAKASPESPSCCAATQFNVFVDNDYSEMGPDAVPIIEAVNQSISCP